MLITVCALVLISVPVRRATMALTALNHVPARMANAMMVWYNSSPTFTISPHVVITHWDDYISVSLYILYHVT